MAFRVVVPSARYEDVTTDNLDQAWRICMDLSIEFGYAEVRRKNAAPGPIIGSYTNGK